MTTESTRNILSKEETFYLRISHLLLRYGATAVRVYFDQELHPSCLGRELSKNYTLLSKLKLSAEQWETLYPADRSSQSSNGYDITLMTLLLKHLADIYISDMLPPDEDHSKEAAVSRIKYYRNKISHSNTGQIIEADFQNIWNRIVYKSIVVLCPGMKMTCEKLESDIIDYSVKHRIQNLLAKESINDMAIQAYQEFDIERENLEEYQLQLKRSWKMQLQRFYQTKSTLDAQEKFRNVHRLIVIGCPGSGKSALAYHLAFFYEQKEGYSVVPLHSPEDIFRFRDKTRKQIFLFDDAFGSYFVEPSNLHKWGQRSDYFLRFLNTDNSKIILTCRSQIYETKEVQDLKIVTGILVHTTNKDLSLVERKGICRMYLSENELSSLEDAVISMYQFLPWICSAYNKSTSDIVSFFKKPRNFLKNEIDRLKSHSSYFSLALLVLSNNKLDKKDLENSEYRLKHLFEESELHQQHSKQSVLSGFQNLKHMFIQESELYFFCRYDQVFDIIVHSVGSTFPRSILRYAHPEIIRSRIQFKRFGHTYSENTILINGHLEHIYYNKLLIFLKFGLNWEVFGNVQCQYEDYRKDFLRFLEKQKRPFFFNSSKSLSAFYVSSHLGYYDFCKFIADNDFQQLFEVRKGNHTSFHHICFKGHFKIAALVVKKIKDLKITTKLLCSTGLFHLLFSQSFISIKSWYHALYVTLSKALIGDIKDKCCSHGKTPLLMAIEHNNIDIINLLLPCYISVNRDIKNIGTALHYACTLGRAEIADLLINYDADVNRKRKKDGSTPLHCSCRHGNETVVNVLLKHKANINMSSNQQTPLLEACFFSQTKIVKILLKHGASANKQGQSSETPLHVAATIGNAEIIKLLLKANAKMHFDFNGLNPLHLACSKGHVSVVVELLKHYVPETIFNKGNFGISPLIVASSFGHADVVSVLLENGADVDFVDGKGNTPLKLAIRNGFADVTEILLKNGAKIDKTLHIACELGNETIVNMLLSKRADVFELNENYGTPLHETCGSIPELPTGLSTSSLEKDFLNVYNSVVGIEKLFTYIKDDIERTECEELYNRSLHQACYYANKTHVKFLLENGEDVNKAYALGSTPLFIACLRGNSDVVELLLENGANVNQPSIDGFTPLSAACFTDTNKTVRLLLETSANVNWENNSGLVPLHIAVKTGNINVVKYLLEKGANINKQSNNGQTSLFIACYENRVDIAKLLLKNHANVNLPLRNNATPLDFVSVKGHLEIAELLLQHNASVNYGGVQSFNPLFLALQNGKTDVARILLNWKASLSRIYKCKFTPLHSLLKNDSNLEDASLLFILFWTNALQLLYANEYDILEHWLWLALHTYLINYIFTTRPSILLHKACSEGNIIMVEFLLRSNLNVNKSYLDFKTPLHKACQNRHMNVANLLLMHGAKIQQKDENGKTLLHFIYETDDRENVQMLVQNGVSINRTDSDGQTPLYIAAQNANIEVMEYLLENQCCVNSNCLNGRSSLHASCATNKTKPLALLLKYGGHIDAIDNFGNTPLHISCQYGHFNVSELLILHNVKINTQNSEGATPLHIACSEGYIDIVLLLMKWGVNINIRDITGNTALYYACMNGYKNIATLLLQYRQPLTESYNESIKCLQICIDKDYADIIEIIIVRRKILTIGNYLLDNGCENGKYNIAELSLKFKPSVNVQDENGKTPLFKASENNHIKIVILLLRNGARIDDRCVDGMTSLFVACKNGHTKVALILIEQKADIYRENNEHLLPYQVASLLGYTDICDIFEKQKQKLPNHVDQSVYEKYTILRKSAEKLQKKKSNIQAILPTKHKEIAKTILAFKGLINRQDKYGRSPLHRACNAGRSEIVEQLLENGATFSKDEYGYTGLHFACLQGHEKVVIILLRYKAKLDQQDRHGNTPLHFASLAGYAKITEILIKAKANIGIMNNHKDTPLSLAIIHNHKNVLEILLKYGAPVHTSHNSGLFPVSPITLALMYFRFDMLSSILRSLGK